MSLTSSIVPIWGSIIINIDNGILMIIVINWSREVKIIFTAFTSFLQNYRVV